MDSFRTDVSISPSPIKISLKSGVFTTGSCFADAIGNRLAQFKFATQVNPFGVLYNPLSIHKTMRMAILHEPPAEHTFLENGTIHYNYDFHSALSAPDKTTLSAEIRNRIGAAHYFLKDAAWILITYGTAWVYTRKDTGETVANCHKMPGRHFTRVLLREHEMVESFATFYNDLLQFNPNAKIILTLSPVRHIKDTLELNSVSKAMLRVVCHRIAERFPVDYFPAYEMMMDDLRDYRFYKSDMLHPTEDAENYIWAKFAARYFDDETSLFLHQWKAIRAALAHKPFHRTSPAHQRFLTDTLDKLAALKTTVDVSEEISYLRAQLI